uniref:MADS-box domain-containing protein n=1 Tax=Leersia perrieri TaxID=77586 RepID=A0A0D9X6F1_9ORYZ
MRRGKVKIKPILDARARDVCFSKRRQVVMKKANELSILCGVDVAVVVYSPAGKPYSFGSPSSQAITHRLLGMAPSNPTMGDGSNGSGGETNILHELNLKYQQIQQENEVENKKNKTSQQAVNNEHGEHVRLDSDVNVLELHELEAFDSKLNIIDEAVHLYHVVKNGKQALEPQPEINMPTTLQLTFNGQRIAPSP